jgi:hypothetical protein
LIVSILFLAGGLTLIFGYAHGTAGLSAALPIAGSTLNINVNTAGLPALGGIALLAIGVLFLLWALIAAIAGQLMLFAGGSYKGPSKLLDYDNAIRDDDESGIEHSGARSSHTLLG